MEQFYDAVDLLKGMISRPSFSRGEADVAAYLQAAWRAAGQLVRRKGNNLWIASPAFNSAKPTLLLNSHIDTVKPVAGWTKNPFAPEEDAEERLYGLGSNDAGASTVALYEAFRLLNARKQPYNLIFLASAEEEISGNGGIASVLPELPPVAFGVVGEPTDMRPAVAEKGLLVLDCLSRGISGHAARSEGINAIGLAMEDIHWFHTYLFPRQSDLLGAVKMTVTMIRAGTQHNVIPDECRFTVDIRVNEFYSNRTICDEIRQHVRCDVAPRSLRLNSSRIDATHPFVQRAVMLGREPFGSPTLSDQALMPFPTVKIGPGDSARSHTADEWIRPAEIREAIDLYVRLLDGLQLPRGDKQPDAGDDGTVLPVGK
ncbi:MAG: M20 family metallo-hydrolase [Tannerella sp.]|jgi:acetylornithine deacetylase|nr:M20 family metallo-hydrolase [Tannerella sp.]